MEPVAPRISWDYVELEYIGIDFDESDLDSGNGIGISIYRSPWERIFLSGNFEYLSADNINDTSVSLYSLSAGGGVYLPIQNNLQLVGELIGSYSWGDEFGGEFALSPGAGVRWGMTDRVELYTSAYYTISENSDGAVDIAIGTIIGVNEHLSLIGGYIFNDLGDGDRTFYGGLQIPF